MSLILKIMGSEKFGQFVPVVPSYAIRIRGTTYHANQSFLPMTPSSLWIETDTYIFDDIEYESTHTKENELYQSINLDIARDILMNFKQKVLDAPPRTVEQIVIHCYKGTSRSPAVAIGLETTFSLGWDLPLLEHKFPTYNGFVVVNLEKAAKTLFPK